MLLTSELPLDQKERFKLWADKFERMNKQRPMEKVLCYICDAEMFVEYRATKALHFKPICSDSCRIDLNALREFIS